MKKILGLCLLGLTAPIAQASIQLDNISCSSGLSISDQNGVGFGCGGDLSMSGGSMSVEGGNLFITAGGSLSLNNLLLSAINVNLQADSLFIGDDVSFNFNGQGIGGMVSGSGIRTPSEVGRSDLTAVFVPTLDISLGGNISATRGSRQALIAPSIIFPGGNISVFAPQLQLTPREVVVIQPVSNIMLQATPVAVPLPGALLSWLSGFALCAAASLRRRIRGVSA